MVSKLSNILRTGDIIFCVNPKKDGISKLITKVTFGKAFHVALVYSKYSIFETDGEWGHAKFTNMTEYDEESIEVYRLNTLSFAQKQRIKRRCLELEGSPYSYWDIVVKGILAPIHPKISGWVAEKLGTKKFMICNELTMRIIFEATGLSLFDSPERWNPEEMRLLCVENPETFSRILVQ